ncbi:MAG: hypothetical protein ABIJ39_07180 [Chloroflexota bacterium]
MEMLGLSLLIIFTGIATIALLAAVGLLMDRSMQQARIFLEKNLTRAFGLGLANTVFLILLVGLFLGLANLLPAIQWLFLLLAAVISIWFTLLALFGLSALADFLGIRMGVGGHPFRIRVFGGLLLLLSSIAPYIGWFLFFPIMVFIALGTAYLTFFRKTSPPDSILEPTE